MQFSEKGNARLVASLTGMQISRHDENVVEALNGGDAPVLSEWHGKPFQKSTTTRSTLDCEGMIGHITRSSPNTRLRQG